MLRCWIKALLVEKEGRRRMSSDAVCIIKPSHGMKFGPNCIAIGTHVPVEKDGQVLGHA